MACRECITGSLHEGDPTGRTETVHGLPTYISEPLSGQPPNGIIVFIPDGVGWEFLNNRLLADKYAKATNSRVYLPDFMNGGSMSVALFASMDIILTKSTWMNTLMKMSVPNKPFLGQYYDILTLKPSPAVFHCLYHFVPFMFHNRTSVAHPIVLQFMRALRDNEGASLPIGAAGFCWGGKHVFLLCRDTTKSSSGQSLLDCGFVAHPSNLVIPVDAEEVKLPCSVSVGDLDMALPLAQVMQTKEIFERKNADEGEKHEVVVIPGATHGFAIRGNPYEEKSVEHGRQAEKQAIDWFNRWFAKGSG